MDTNSSMKEQTHTGFSKRFSACGRWRHCNLGQDECYYTTTGIDLEAHKGCACYQRHRNPKRVKQAHRPASESVEEPILSSEGQLSLF
ncbi:hypothetical protein [Pontibacillus halophilus]|uniref:hypothetical protein n=1 Tax=Pontibacillus halophilus TaxID=516704 RepID=UPI000563A5FE|nr:hypothetical protein [Pontibacillus halophilus]